MRGDEMICNMDCSNCIHDDCINGELTAEEIKRQDKADKEMTDLADWKQIAKREYVKQYNRANKERIREYKKQYYQQNKQKCKDAVLQWQKDNREYHNAYAREWYHENKGGQYETTRPI